MVEFVFHEENFQLAVHEGMGLHTLFESKCCPHVGINTATSWLLFGNITININNRCVVPLLGISVSCCGQFEEASIGCTVEDDNRK